MIKSLWQWFADENDTSLEEAESLDQWLKFGVHEGDCTNQNFSCPLCLLENTLSEYYEYCKRQKHVK